MVFISFWISWSFPSLSDNSLFFSLREEKRLTLLRDNEPMLSENTPPESLWPFRDTCCSKEGRSCPAPHGSASIDAHQDSGLAAAFSSPDGSKLSVLKMEPRLNAPSDMGLFLRDLSRVGRLFINYKAKEGVKIRQVDFYRNSAYSSFKVALKLKQRTLYIHYDCSVGAPGGIGHTKLPPEGVGYELESWEGRGRGLALRWFSILAWVFMKLICFCLCWYLIKHQRAIKM